MDLGSAKVPAPRVTSDAQKKYLHDRPFPGILHNPDLLCPETVKKTFY